ncbi:MAG: tRNA pseudouridine(38-40) synthase TruA [Amoebophilaceae bacterium]|jgi:tRNA pseudouridine38-40 synthase|nr:tRNA pseudouridine(38-40) synthase TruA [Amoebophilaceae bacterium]
MISERTLRYFLQIAYLGTRYHGWQQQQNAITVQGVLQACLSQILRSNVKVVGSSRTDAGVHARQQFVHLDLPCTVAADCLHYQLNAVLPPDIAVVAMRLVKPTVHARFDALARTYEYTILRCKTPFQYETSCLLRGELDVHRMNEAAAILCRKQDFKGLCKVRVDDAHFLCDITEASWSVQEERLVFRIKANRFLRSMVRVIVSLLLKIGQGKLSLLAFEALIDQKERNLAVSLVPARGLTLTQVIYPEAVFLS